MEGVYGWLMEDLAEKGEPVVSSNGVCFRGAGVLEEEGEEKMVWGHQEDICPLQAHGMKKRNCSHYRGARGERKHRP